MSFRMVSEHYPEKYQAVIDEDERSYHVQYIKDGSTFLTRTIAKSAGGFTTVMEECKAWLNGVQQL